MVCHLNDWHPSMYSGIVKKVRLTLALDGFKSSESQGFLSVSTIVYYH